MARFLTNRNEKIGTAPGSLVFVGEKRTDKVQLDFLSYDAETIFEKEIENISEVAKLIDPKQVAWLNLVGLHDVATIEQVGGQFDIHPLQLEDILNTAQRPKFEETDANVFIQIRMLHLKEDNTLYTEQLSILLQNNLLISFQEIPQDVFDPLRERLFAFCRGFN